MNLIVLHALPWTPAVHLKGSLLPSDLTRQTIQIWNQLISFRTISKPMGPITPCLGPRPFLRLCMGQGSDPGREDHWRLAQVLRADPSLTADTPSRSFSQRPAHWLQRQQAISYIRTFPSLSVILSDLPNFENMQLQTDPPTHVVSQLYSLIHTASNPDLPLYSKTLE